MTDVRRLAVRGRYRNVPVITSFVAEAAAAAGLDEAGIYHCQMAVDEACTNIIEHAYGGEDIGDIEVTCTIEPGVCRIQVVDHGQPFDPQSVPTPSFDGPIEELKPGGIGLHLMRQFMDVVRFEFGPEGNTLLLVKSAQPRGGEEAYGAVGVQEVEPGIWLVTPGGRLDSPSAPDFEQLLREQLDEGRVWLVVDMQDVTYISSRGLKALVTAWRRARAAGGDVLLAAMGAHVYNVFETVGFTRLFTIYNTRDEALAHARSHQA